MSRFESLRRLGALVRKEFRQMRRDPSVIVVSFGLPMMLLLVFGYGLSMDLKNVPVAVVLGESSPQAQNVAERIDASPYFRSIPTARAKRRKSFWPRAKSKRSSTFRPGSSAMPRRARAKSVSSFTGWTPTARRSSAPTWRPRFRSPPRRTRSAGRLWQVPPETGHLPRFGSSRAPGSTKRTPRPGTSCRGLRSFS